MPTARRPLDVDTEAEPPFLEQDGLKLNRSVVRKEFSGDMVGTSKAQLPTGVSERDGVAGPDDLIAVSAGDLLQEPASLRVWIRPLC